MNTMTKLRAGQPEFDSRQGNGFDFFLFVTVSRHALESVQSSNPTGTGGSFPGGKAAGG
jgi:hypothetical protein